MSPRIDATLIYERIRQQIWPLVGVVALGVTIAVAGGRRLGARTLHVTPSGGHHSMRFLGLLGAAAVATIGCKPSFSPKPTPEVIAAMPDTISCDSAVRVEAGGERAGINAEHRWLDTFYPRHGDTRQSLAVAAGGPRDVFVFKRANGHDASICFDIKAFFGKDF